MSEMLSWAEKELELAGYRSDDMEEGPNKWLREGVLELLKVFSGHGHSGMSAPFAISIFESLASFRPLTPLTGEDDEWNDVGEGTYQNNRASNVFKNQDGDAYQIDGIVFWEWFTGEDGERHKSYFTCSDSQVPVIFPYTVPDKPEYRERVENDDS